MLDIINTRQTASWATYLLTKFAVTLTVQISSLK